MRCFLNFLSVDVFILILLFIGEYKIAFSKDLQNKNQTLGLTCVNAYWPISGSTALNADIITSPFGIRYSSVDGYDFHEGIDIRANFDPVHAFTDGTVDKKGRETSGAYFVRLRHVDPCDGSTFYTYYTHLDNDVLYTNLKVGTSLTGGQVFVTSGNSGGVPPHLHFAGLVGGTSTLTNAINPMRDDSLPYINGIPASDMIVITQSRDDGLTFQIRTPKEELDLNKIEVKEIDISGVLEDSFFMDFDARHGIDHKSRSGENGDEDGVVVETTDLLGLTINYTLSSFNFNPDQNDFHTVQVDLQYANGWSSFNEIDITATDTQNSMLEHRVFVGDIYYSITLNGIIDMAGYESLLYSGENEMHITNGSIVTIQTGSVFNVIDNMNLVIDPGAQLII